MKNEADELAIELGDFRTSHQAGLNDFDFNQCSSSEVIFMQIFENESFPDTYKILFSREDSGGALKEINSRTGTPTPWISCHEIVFFNSDKKIKSIYNSLKSYSLGNKTYSMPFDKLDKLIEKAQATKANPELHTYVRGLSDSVVVITSNDRDDIDSKIGFVYCFKHVRSPDRCKIGYTNRDPRIRAAENSLDAALPDSYKPIFACLSNNAHALEEKIHEQLNDIHINKEYFKADPKVIANAFLNEYSSGNALGFFCYDENQKYFSEISFKNLAEEYFFEKYNISKSEFYDKQTQDYYDLYEKGFKDVLFSFLIEVKYKSILNKINSKIQPFEESKSFLTQKTKSYGDSQKKLTQSGGVLTGLALIAFDAGASLVPAALSAAGLLVNKRRNNSRKFEIEKFDYQLKALYEEKDLIFSQVNIELTQHSQNLDDFFNCSAKKIMSKYADGSSYHAGYEINLEGNSSLYSPEHKFSITALKVVTTPPKSSLSKEKVSLIRLTVSPLNKNSYYPYKDIELLESEKVLNICALLREYSLMGQYYIAII